MTEVQSKVGFIDDIQEVESSSPLSVFEGVTIVKREGEVYVNNVMTGEMSGAGLHHLRDKLSYLSQDEGVAALCRAVDEEIRMWNAAIGKATPQAVREKAIAQAVLEARMLDIANRPCRNEVKRREMVAELLAGRTDDIGVFKTPFVEVAVEYSKSEPGLLISTVTGSYKAEPFHITQINLDAMLNELIKF